MARTPELKSFLVADTVLQEKGTGKWSVIGIFDRISARAFPLLYHSVGLFITVADAEGSYDVRVDFLDSADRRIATFGGMRLDGADPTRMVSFGLQTHNVAIPREGRYHFALYFGQDLVGMMPIDVVKVQ